MTKMPEDLAQRIVPEDQHKHIPAAEWSDLWEYHLAVLGKGSLAHTWKDKSHRLVYNLTRIIADMRKTHHATITDMAKRLEAAERDAKRLAALEQAMEEEVRCIDRMRVEERADEIMRGGE